MLQLARRAQLTLARSPVKESGVCHREEAARGGRPISADVSDGHRQFAVPDSNLRGASIAGGKPSKRRAGPACSRGVISQNAGDLSGHFSGTGVIQPNAGRRWPEDVSRPPDNYRDTAPLAGAVLDAPFVVEPTHKKAAWQHACPFHNISQDRAGGCG